MGEYAALCGHLIVGSVCVLALKTVKALTNFLVYNILQPVAMTLGKWIQSFTTSNYESPYMERIHATRTSAPDISNLLGRPGVYLKRRIPERSPFMSDADLTFLDLTNKKPRKSSFRETAYSRWERFRQQMSDDDDDFPETHFPRYGFAPRS